MVARAAARGRGLSPERGGGGSWEAHGHHRDGEARARFGRERPSRDRDNATSGSSLPASLSWVLVLETGWRERSLARVSSAVGPCEPVTAAVAPRPRGSEVRGGGEEGKGPGRVSAHFLPGLRRFQRAAAAVILDSGAAGFPADR